MNLEKAKELFTNPQKMRHFINKNKKDVINWVHIYCLLFFILLRKI